MTNDLTLRQRALALIEDEPADDTGLAIDDSRREIRLGIIVAGLFFVLFLGWAAFARLDSAAYAHGQLVVSGQRQSVQHRDGGVVAVIKVAEGQHVRKGDTLIELAGAEVRAQERALAAQLVNSQAQRARLEAELAGSATITWPPDFATATGSTLAAIPEAIRTQSSEFQARRSALVAQSQVLGQQSAQANQSASGFRSKMVSSAEQERLIQAEIDALRPVADKGFVSQSRMRALERAKAELQGERGQYQASVAVGGRRQQPHQAFARLAPHVLRIGQGGGGRLRDRQGQQLTDQDGRLVVTGRHPGEEFAQAGGVDGGRLIGANTDPMLEPPDDRV